MEGELKGTLPATAGGTSPELAKREYILTCGKRGNGHSPYVEHGNSLVSKGVEETTARRKNAITGLLLLLLRSGSLVLPPRMLTSVILRTNLRSGHDHFPNFTNKETEAKVICPRSLG